MFSKVRILDGGLASTLQLMGKEMDGDPLWSARLLHTDPDAIIKAHTIFLEAGSDVLITCSYQASIDGFTKNLGISSREALGLIEKSVLFAKKAKENFLKENNDRSILIAGSVGPYGACLCDYSEYSGNYVNTMTRQQLKDWHKPRMEALVRAGVDIIAFETIPALEEAIVLLQILKEFPNAKAWVTFSCKDGNFTNHGDDFGKAVESCWSENCDQLAAIGVNCTCPLLTTSLLQKAQETVPFTKLPRIVYPGSGETYNRSDKKWEGNANLLIETFKNEFKLWLDLGVKGIGGCCNVTPENIREICHTVNEHQNN